jgi:hypothetical protein
MKKLLSRLIRQLIKIASYIADAIEPPNQWYLEASESVDEPNPSEPNYVTREELEEAIRRATEQGAQNGARITASWLKSSTSKRRRHGV